jgi:hypothetical protein
MKLLGLKLGVALLTFVVGVGGSFLFLASSGFVDLNSISADMSRVETDVESFVDPVSENEPSRARFSVTGVDDDSEVAKFWSDFQLAVASDDRKQVAAMAKYPLQINYYDDPLENRYRSVKNRKAFLKIYDKIFDDALKGMIANTSFQDIWGNYHGIATPRGEIWIGVFCIDNNANCNHEIKLRTIHANSVFIERE